ncbi:MAG: MATE family efflux transporter [Oscillospiraceae bacterium]|nr:MATE family efflux transporter [Oscillospiraceae bacterium]
MQQKRVGKDLTQGSILKTLLIFAFPLILTNLVQQLYSTVDLIIIGRFVGPVGTVGVSTGGELSDFMTPFAMAFASAGQVYIAQLSGAKDEKGIREAAGTLLTLLLGLSFIFMLGSILFYKPLLGLLNCPEEAFSQASGYMIVTALGFPFIYGYNAVCAILRGMGESKRPLLFVSVAATLNIFFDLLFVVVFRMEAVGTAIATVISQMGSFFASFYFLYKKREQFGFQLRLSYFRINGHALRVMMRLGIPQFVRSMSVHFSMLWVKANINSFGLVASATYSVGNKLEKNLNVFVGGIDAAAGAMIGQNIGARKHDRVVKTMWTTLACAVSCALVIMALFWGVPKPLFRLFTADEAVVEYGVTYLRIMSLAVLFGAMAGTFKAIATGAGAAGICFMIGILDGICRIGACLIFVAINHAGATDYFWGGVACHVIPGLMCMVYFLSGKWKTKKLLSER